MLKNNAILIAFFMVIWDASISSSHAASTREENNKHERVGCESQAYNNEQKTNKAVITLRCYLPFLLNVSKELSIDPALVLAIMHQESGFDIAARSKSNALGLMQIMPKTSGQDVTSKLTGKTVTLSEDFVLEPKKNIALGIQYLNILKQNYLSKINDKDSQRLAILAAYNGGIGNLRRWCISLEPEKLNLENQINSQSPEQFKQLLINHHPLIETKNYVKKVEKHYQFYSQLLNKYKQ